MTQQTEALRLADVLEEKPDSDGHCRQAAAELRRLYQLAQDQHTEIYGLRLKVRNLLGALRFIADRQDLMFAECSDAEEIIEVARAAIKTAKGEA
jgi:hypothetical protein